MIWVFQPHALHPDSRMVHRYFTTLVIFLVSAASTHADDWTTWRGENHDGIASAEQDPPVEWDESKNMVWRATIPGRGHGSPTVLGNQVFLQTADKERNCQSVICFDRSTGDQIWETIVHEGGLKIKGRLNQKATLASSTIATDGEQLFANFLNDGAVHTTSLSLTGEILWRAKITDYIVHQGFGTSPAVYKDLVIVSADTKSGGAVVGLDKKSGQERWRHDRPKKPNYASPIIVNASGKTQLVFTGCDLVTSLDPSTGKLNWEHEGATTECVASTLTDGKHIFTSGGYPKNHIAAVVADGSGKVTWEVNTRVYVPSMIVHKNHLFAILDAGFAACIRCEDGEEVWRSRLGGTFSSSPVMVGDRIYATNESGETFVFQANTEKFVRLAKNKLGESVFATPAICGGQIFMRVAHTKGDERQEYLYCLEK